MAVKYLSTGCAGRPRGGRPAAVDIAQVVAPIIAGRCMLVARWAGRWLLVGRQPCASLCATQFAAARDMWRRPPSGESPASLRRLNFTSRYCSGLSRAAHEVFGPIFDIGPILVNFEILRFLGLKLF
ncbi:denticleless protein [Dorcoceras hygrometricum]|uniref:Denticleless protein n=1 Tax=Dorcoceras hygrometricum TaxID=472368 RepID=A0A2Z7CTR3_9LAMI|nr:denticleless protein [Dorcoceras hygrometricum]